jgi:prepilin-type N-terminal cleavage/methylation domain-containing protein
MKSNTTFKTGFTLIELMVVIAIIAVLSSIVISATVAARTKAQYARDVSSVLQLKNALELYEDKHGEYPCEKTDVVVGGTTYCTYGFTSNITSPESTGGSSASHSSFPEVFDNTVVADGFLSKTPVPTNGSRTTAPVYFFQYILPAWPGWVSSGFVPYCGDQVMTRYVVIVRSASQPVKLPQYRVSLGGGAITDQVGQSCFGA